MKGRYRQVVTAIWNDRKVRELPPDGKLLFIYLITCGHGHVSGLYLLPIAAAARETGLSERRIRALLVAGEMTPVVSFDPKFGVVWVRSMLKHQGRGENRGGSHRTGPHARRLEPLEGAGRAVRR